MQLSFQSLNTISAAPLLSALHAQCFEQPWDEKAFSELLSLPSTAAHIVTNDDIPLGFCFYQITQDEAEILSVGIVPAKRGLSAGTALLAHGFKFLADRQVNRLLLEVSETNTAARTLYLKSGFTEIGRRKGYYREKGTRRDALMYEKLL